VAVASAPLLALAAAFFFGLASVFLKRGLISSG
jgi:hypothetical protein